MKGFSLLEAILMISIFAIISFMAFPKIIINKKQIDKFKLKTDVGAIRLGLVDKFYDNATKGDNGYIILDNARIDISGDRLFSNIIKHDIISSSLFESKMNAWIKTGKYQYSYVLDNGNLEFVYDIKNNTFQCDKIHTYCHKLNQ